MSDLIVFGFGFLVSLIVLFAVGLLFWGVSNEPSVREVPEDRVAAHPLPHRAVPDGLPDTVPTSTEGASA